MSEYKDYYKILGVGKNASEADIKKAFKTQARKYHPDMHPESEKAAMTEKFKDINEAYEVLSDKQKRAIYDQVGSGGYQNYARGGGASTGRGSSSYGSSGAGGAQYYQYSGGNPFGGGGVHFNGTGGFNASDFSDFFQQIFGGMGGFSGRGRRSSASANPFAGFGGASAQQAESGDSEANLSLDLAEAYRGGLVNLTLPNGRNVQVKFPAKIADGAKIKLKGLGNPGPRGSGDLYVNVKIAPNAHFRLDGKDIYKVIDIMPWTAALGGNVSVRMPDDSLVKIKVPAGSHSGRKLKLSGKGLGKNGDMYVQLMINNPNILTKRQKELFAMLKETEE
ncbi:DnaJ C-terminal domain-containing protein [Candidatus Proelusimicrobium volucris]|uniref:DnaJ C-terminal domain-containing protein n=1 Tax=Candidatus Proelusimicrobium volucris TaxID=3416225 RepID=UPI003D09857F